MEAFDWQISLLIPTLYIYCIYMIFLILRVCEINELLQMELLLK